ncbi:hypothetical protein NKI54_33460 [Mesorhizobium sp. M0663]|uniref:hypothetical protein n=1 Tax=Mesorhizobium sp. M0663 TaxID=2956981 RepID=UPI003339CA45
MELANAVRDRYAAATTKDKRRILEEFIAATGYHEKSAIRVLNSHPKPKHRQIRQRLSLYDEAARGALIVLWEASDRVCGKRLKALLPILLSALERNGHLKLEEEIHHKVLSMAPRRSTACSRCQGAPCERKSRQGLCQSRGGASKCALLLTGMIRCPAAWKWTWSLIAGRSTAVATFTAWF